MLGIAYCMFRAREDSFRCQKRTEFFEECLRVMNFCRDGKGLAGRTERKLSFQERSRNFPPQNRETGLVA